jgi:hypothetical protein
MTSEDGAILESKNYSKTPPPSEKEASSSKKNIIIYRG